MTICPNNQSECHGDILSYIKKIIVPYGCNDVPQRMGGGYTSEIFKVKTSFGIHIIKISFQDDLPSEIFFLKRAAVHNIRVPRVISYDFSKKEIPYDYCILEYFDGIRANELSDSKKYEAGALFGKELRKIHAIPVENFGKISYANTFDNHNDWAHILLHRILEVKKEVDTIHASFSNGEDIFLEKILTDKYRYVDTPRLIHSDPGGNNFLVQYNKQNEITNYRIIDPNELVGGDPLYDLAFSQLVWNHQPFMDGVLKGYEAIRLTDEEKHRFMVLNMYLHYWASIASYARGWNIWKRLYEEYQKRKKELTCITS
ncbi:MAG: aminoglycoside phosphotransferase family protein [bacterium]